MHRRWFLLTFTIFLIGSLFGTIRVAEVEASETIYIRADGSIDPPTANITSADNVTYTFIGNINESIVVERDNIVVDGAGYTLQGSGSGVGFDCSSISNVTIQSTNIKEFLQGILLSSASYNTIRGNTLTTNNWYGIWLDSSSNYNSISGNNITANEVYGVYLSSSSNNSIMENTLTDNWDGISLRFSSNYNSISGNNITNNDIGIGLSSSSNNTIQENHITANAAYGIRLSSSSNNTIQENHITANVEYGIWLSTPSIWVPTSSNNTIQENTFIDDGLYVTGSYQNSVENNTVNGKPLVYLEGVSNHTVDEDAGQVILVRCENIRVEGLNLSRTCVGVELWETSNSIISGNHITANSDAGIVLSLSLNCSVFGNHIVSNDYGLWLYWSSSNRIFHNNLISNTNHVISNADSVNIWNDGDLPSGNYWSNYSGVDLDPDGIGDSHHVIASNNTDYYPLMGLFSNFNAISEHYVQTICNSTISGFQHNGTAISFNVTGEEGSAGFCRICIPTALMSDYQIFVNGTEVDYNLLPCSNSSHSYLYFTYQHSTKEVVIIPEFTSLILLPLFMLCTLLAGVFYRRKSKA